MTALHEVSKRNGMKTRLKNCFTAIKSFASVLITIPVAISYICLGAVVFLQFDPPIQWQNRAQLLRRIWSIEEIYSKRIYNATLIGDVAQVEADISGLTQSLINTFTGTDDVFNYAHKYSNDNWTFVPAALQSLCLITAIGSCVNTPPTTASQGFALIYGMLGLPLAVMTVGNVGKYLGKGAAHIVLFINRKVQKFRKANAQKEEVNLNDNKIPRVTFSQVLTMFLLYLIIGAALLPDFQDDNFLSATFLCFVNLTTVAVTHSHTNFTLIYLLFGLALTTVALEVASDYLRKVHFMGRKLRDACSVPIHFGGKDLSVAELLWAFGRKVGLAEDLMTKFMVGMDTFVSATIALKESGQLRKTDVLVRATIEAEHLGIAEISFADDSDSQ